MQVRLYSMFGQRLPGGFSLGEEVARDGVQRAELYGGGLVVLTRRRDTTLSGDLDHRRTAAVAWVCGELCHGIAGSSRRANMVACVTGKQPRTPQHCRTRLATCCCICPCWRCRRCPCCILG